MFFVSCGLNFLLQIRRHRSRAWANDLDRDRPQVVSGHHDRRPISAELRRPHDGPQAPLEGGSDAASVPPPKSGLLEEMKSKCEAK